MTSRVSSGCVLRTGALLLLSLFGAACGDDGSGQQTGTGGSSSALGTGGAVEGSASGGSGGTSLASGGSTSGGAASGGAILADGAGGGSSGGNGSSSGGAGSGGAASVEGTYVPDPSWACGMPEGIVDPTRGELVFGATLEVGSVRDVGQTQYGQRRFADFGGGTTEGERLSASFLEGGLDFELTLDNGTAEVEQVAMLRATDGSYIYMRSCGLAPAGVSTTRVVFDFEVANQSSLAWLNTGTFVGTRSLDAANNQMILQVYDVADVPNDAAKVEWSDPEGVPDQPWECLELSGTRGAEVFTEEVGIGSSLSVGASKRGTRNVIPITGGSVSGRFIGSVVSAGADYQLIGSQTTLDARYALESNDGEFVIVRNCGPFGALVPLFEARAEGPYGFLNENRFLSSDPGGATGGVRITFYEVN